MAPTGGALEKENTMKNRAFWTVTGTLGVVAIGAGVAVADTPPAPSDDAATTTSVPATQPGVDGAPATTTAPDRGPGVGPSIVRTEDFTQRGASAASAASPVSAASSASAASPVSAASPTSPASPSSAPSAPSAD